MTRRIAAAILATVWLVLLVAGVFTYFVTRSILLEDLDQTILSRVASLPDIERPAFLPRSVPDALDRFVIHNAQGKIIKSSGSSPPGTVPPPDITFRTFTAGVGHSRLRTLGLNAFAHRDNPADPLVPVKVVYSASAAPVDGVLARLLYFLGGFGIVAVLATALAARFVARSALKPLALASEIIGQINERSLDRRIDVERLPRELTLVGTRLNDLLSRLETAFAQRRQFIADASHELRTPVAALVTTLEVALRRRRDPDEYMRSLERALSDARLLQKLVVALVEQARAERFVAEPELSPTPVSALLRQCLQLVSPHAQAKGLTLNREFPENLLVVTDEQFLRSVVSNLLSNAVEYTSAESGGTPVVTLSAEMLPLSAPLPPSVLSAIPEGLQARPGRLIIRVVDNGPGIPPAHLPHIFQPFYRADQVRADSAHHLGLGLALVHAAVQALGGACRVESPPPDQTSGCLFTVELPTAEMGGDGTTASNVHGSSFAPALRGPIRQVSP